MPTEPGGISLRGVARRGVANVFGRPVRNGKPGTNPMQATRYSAVLWRSTTSTAEQQRRFGGDGRPNQKQPRCEFFLPTNRTLDPAFLSLWRRRLDRRKVRP